MSVVVGDILRYIWQMLPLCTVALALFLLCRPLRMRRLAARRLVSGPQRRLPCASLCCFAPDWPP